MYILRDFSCINCGVCDRPNLPTVQESMAGRIGKVRLRPLSQGEILSTSPNFIEHAFAQNFICPKTRIARDELLEMIFQGGFPESVRLSGKARKNWHINYIDALIEHDLNDVSNIRQVSLMKDLVRILAAWSTKFMDVTAIGSHLAIERRTLSSYISALESFYIIETLAPWRNTDYERIGKLDKLIMADTGMMTALLGWKKQDLSYDGDKPGKVFETFIHNELAAQIDAAEDIYYLYQYRDREKREIDFIIEKEDRSILAIEVKSGMTVRKSDFKHIEWFRDNLAKERSVVGVVLYTGEDVLPFGKNLWAVPVDCMWGWVI